MYRRFIVDASLCWSLLHQTPYHVAADIVGEITGTSMLEVDKSRFKMAEPIPRFWDECSWVAPLRENIGYIYQLGFDPLIILAEKVIPNILSLYKVKTDVDAQTRWTIAD